MSDSLLRFDNVTFFYEGASRPLIQGLSAHFSRGWTGIVGANGAGKSTILKLATGILSPRSGHILGTADGVYCEQRTDTVPEQLQRLSSATTRDAILIRQRLGVEADWPGRWATLSHGERKRTQIATALWQSPDIFAVDEPTNHLDEQARALLADALVRFRGVGSIVSHDRGLLDMLCHQCLFLDPPDAVIRPGSYSEGARQAREDRSASLRERTIAREELERLRRVGIERAEEVRGAARRLSKKGLARGDRDARAKIDGARLSGKDASAGRRARQIETRIAKAQEKVDGIRVKREYALGIWMEGAVSHRNTLVTLPAATITLGDHRTLTIPDLVMKPTDRIALTGPNGAGKSTLVRRIIDAVNVDPGRLTYIPQEIDRASSRWILEEVRALPGAALGKAMIVVSRLGSRPERVLETDEPSPGEIRKLLLARGIAREPHLIIMDEPTNHLDLPSIECLEDALRECPCGLLLVSHDERFLDALTESRWQINAMTGEGGGFALKEIL